MGLAGIAESTHIVRGGQIGRSVGRLAGELGQVGGVSVSASQDQPHLIAGLASMASPAPVGRARWGGGSTPDGQWCAIRPPGGSAPRSPGWPSGMFPVSEATCFRVLPARRGPEGTMNHMAGRKKIIRRRTWCKLRRADELRRDGQDNEEIAAELEVSAATLYNWRRAYGGMDLNAAKELRSWGQNSPQAAAGRGRAGEGRSAGGGQGKILSPAAKRRAVDMLGTSRASQNGWRASSRARPLHLPTRPAGGEPRSGRRSAGLAARLRPAHPCHGFRRAWAALRHDEHRRINKKKVQRLWAGEGLQRRVHSRRKRAGRPSHPQVCADAPKVVWALDFQFDSTIDGRPSRSPRWSMSTPASRC